MATPNVFLRLLYSLLVFFRFIFDARFAEGVLAAWKGAPTGALPLPEREPERPAPLPPAAPAAPAAPAREAAPREPETASALHLLAILQREGRFVDFLQEDVSAFPDADVGAAARVVHDGCRDALAQYLALEPLRSEGEGASVVVPKGFDPSAIRLTGNVTGEPPFTGALRHHGWRAAEVRLPAPPTGQDLRVIAPAEVEL